MKILAYILIAYGVIRFVVVGIAEVRGVAYAHGYRTPGEYVRREDRPERFHDAISFEAFYGCIMLISGVVVLGVAKRMDESDPESPNYAGSKALDDWSRALDMEAERRGLKKPKQDEGDP